MRNFKRIVRIRMDSEIFDFGERDGLIFGGRSVGGDEVLREDKGRLVEDEWGEEDESRRTLG